MVDENLSASEELERSLQYAATAKQSGLETSGKLSQQNGKFPEMYDFRLSTSAKFIVPSVVIY